MYVKGEHEIYCCGARVKISEKRVEVLTDPTVKYCPLHEALYGTKQIDADAVQKSVEMKIAGFGFCCANRIFNAEPVVAYGASEMMHVWLEKRFVDCAVVVCEGAGTVIVNKGRLVQAIGARLTGIIRTSPVKEIIESIEANGGVVLDKTRARIDQIEGVKRAFDLGYRRVVVSVAGFQAKAISEIRQVEKKEKIYYQYHSPNGYSVHTLDQGHSYRAEINKCLRDSFQFLWQRPSNYVSKIAFGNANRFDHIAVNMRCIQEIRHKRDEELRWKDIKNRVTQSERELYGKSSDGAHAFTTYSPNIAHVREEDAIYLFDFTLDCLLKNL